MDCSNCDDDGAVRMEMRFPNGSTLALYLCRECAESRDDDGDATLVSAPRS